MSTTTTTTRSARLAAIVGGAMVRRHLGQAAQHEVLDDGQHVVRLHGRVGVRPTVAEAIASIKEGSQS